MERWEQLGESVKQIRMGMAVVKSCVVNVAFFHSKSWLRKDVSASSTGVVKSGASNALPIRQNTFVNRKMMGVHLLANE